MAGQPAHQRLDGARRCHRVGIEQQHVVAAGGANAEIVGARETGVGGGGNHLHRGPARPHEVRGAVGRGVVDHGDRGRERFGMANQRIEARPNLGRRVVGHDDDGERRRSIRQPRLPRWQRAWRRQCASNRTCASTAGAWPSTPWRTRSSVRPATSAAEMASRPAVAGTYCAAATCGFARNRRVEQHGRHARRQRLEWRQTEAFVLRQEGEHRGAAHTSRRGRHHRRRRASGCDRDAATAARRASRSTRGRRVRFSPTISSCAIGTWSATASNAAIN